MAICEKANTVMLHAGKYPSWSLQPTQVLQNPEVKSALFHAEIDAMNKLWGIGMSHAGLGTVRQAAVAQGPAQQPYLLSCPKLVK